MPLIPFLLLLWPMALMAVALGLTYALAQRPDHEDEVWRLPRVAPSRLDFVR